MHCLVQIRCVPCGRQGKQGEEEVSEMQHIGSEGSSHHVPCLLQMLMSQRFIITISFFLFFKFPCMQKLPHFSSLCCRMIHLLIYETFGLTALLIIHGASRSQASLFKLCFVLS